MSLDDVNNPPEDAPRALRVTRASQIKMRATRWLWETSDFFTDDRWLPLGGLTLLGGREGCGKTTWAYRLVAEVTNGTLPGDLYGKPKSAVIAATEDDWARTIVPRLAAAGADLDRVLRVDVDIDGMVEGLTLPTDIAALTKLCADEDVALIVLDPLMGTISTALDPNKDQQVRQALEPLSRLAHDAQLTIIGLIHANKSQGVDLLTRLMASRAFAAVARAVLYAAAEPTDADADGTVGETYLLGQIKSNLGPKVPHAIRYRIEGVKVGHDDETGKEIWSSKVEPDGTVDGYMDDLLAEIKRTPAAESMQGQAVTWLRQFLANGPVEAAKIRVAAAAQQISESTLKRAATTLHVVSNPIPGTTNARMWSLPIDEPTEPTDLTEPTEPTEPSSGQLNGVRAREADPTPDPARCRVCEQRLLTTPSKAAGICVRCLPVVPTENGQVADSGTRSEAAA